MSKRFIDSGIFDDDWFMDLSKDAKLLWVYFITKCDHSGMIKLNSKLCKVQTGISDIQTVIKELGNRLVIVSELLYFIPKYIVFQYPGFPNSKVRQQQSAVDILTKHGLFNNGKVTVNQELVNSYVNVIVNDTVNVNEDLASKFIFFWDSYHDITKLLKSDKDSALKYWKKLNCSDQIKAIENIKPYYDLLSDKKYCKKARTYLSDKNFNDEFKISVPIKIDKKIYREGDLIPDENWVEPQRQSNVQRN